jgi:hypothetical protein
VSLTEADFALRTEVFRSFAQSGAPPELGPGHGPALARLAEAHAVVLDEDGRIEMAHPFAAHRRGACVRADGREWWGNCAWDALGIAGVLGLRDAEIAGNGVALDLRDGAPADDVLFHVLVPAAHWWDDIGFT